LKLILTIQLKAMKSQLRTLHRRIPTMMAALVVMLLSSQQIFSQLPDCASGNVMYSIWNDSSGSTNSRPGYHTASQIRPVTYATGAVGAQLGSGFTISRTISGTTYYGASAMGMDLTRFYGITQMGFAGGRKDIVNIKPDAPTSVTVIATTPSSSTADVPNATGLSDYFFVKMAMNPTFTRGYMIGVHRDTTVGGFTPAICNPLVSFTPCASSNCSTVRLLGYLPTSFPSHNWEIYNGDIAFNSVGDLYYVTAGYGNNRYTDIRLFRIMGTDIPSTAGTGIIPMTFVADYNTLDSTVLNGTAFDALGRLYISTRKFNGIQNTSGLTYDNELYVSSSAGIATVLPQFEATHPLEYSAADLASCYFPLAVLDRNVLKLTARYASGYADLVWTVNDNNRINYFEIQRSDDGENFETIERMSAINTGRADHTYSFRDAQSGFGKPIFYRIRENMVNGGLRFYSNIAKINFNSKITLVTKPKPNPFVGYVDFDVQLKANATISLLVVDNNGKVVYSRKFDGHAGQNKITVNDFSQLAAGIYVAELAVDDEVVREKIIKNNQEP
jgi:hypothetical protein